MRRPVSCSPVHTQPAAGCNGAPVRHALGCAIVEEGHEAARQGVGRRVASRQEVQPASVADNVLRPRPGA